MMITIKNKMTYLENLSCYLGLAWAIYRKNSRLPNLELGKKLPDDKIRGVVIIYLTMEWLFGGKRGNASDLKH